MAAELRRLQAGQKIASPNKGEDVVISGIAGRFPNSDNTKDFMENLMNKVNLCDDDDRRWVHTHPEIPKVSGKINKVDKFDVGYFAVHEGQANAVDPLQRMILERACEAVMDAGMNPDDLAGTNTGVFIGTCYTESEKPLFYEKLSSQNHAILGCQRSMQAQRISYCLKLNGPSMICDTACSSGMYAFEMAYRSIREGKCEQALVGGTNLCFDAYCTLQFARLGVLNMNTGCRPFDENASGYTRSEAIVVMLLQKSKDAKRVYSEIVHAKVNVDGYKELGITYPSAMVQKVLLEDVYGECNIDPLSLAFVEAHGTGTKVGDPEELMAIDEVFCTGRDKPLLIGSVKGNIGHTEPASGLCSIVKMIYAMETGFIPPNIHYENPKLSVEGLGSKRLIVVTEKTPWPTHSSLGGVNCFGFGGANGHVVMKRHQKLNTIFYDDIPRLVCFSGRTAECIQSYQNNLKDMDINYEYIGLIQQTFMKSISRHPYRGYSIVSRDGEITRSGVQYADKNRPLYLSIGNSNKYTYKSIKDLQKIDIFKTSFRKITKILKLNSINIDLISKPAKNDMMHQILLTVALQIGVIDILKALNIVFDHIVCTSLGDFTSAYANNTLTMEQVLLATYSVSELVLNSHGNKTNLKGTILQKLKALINNNPTDNDKVQTPKFNMFKYGSPEYFLFNIFNPHFLNEAARDIKNDALVVSIDSNSRSIPKLNLIEFIKPDMGISDILLSIGRLYENGLQPKIDELYPKISWPVSRGTPMFSPNIKWDHNNNYDTPTRAQNHFQKYSKGVEKIIAISITNSDLMFYKGHVIDGRTLFPATGYLYLIWEFYNEVMRKPLNKTKVCFENIKFHRATVFGKGLLKLNLGIQRSGLFEVADENETTIVTGKFMDLSETDLMPVDFESINNKEYETLNKSDVYKELKIRGYNYRGLFKGIKELQGNIAQIEWTGNWITFMDNMLQISICCDDSRNLYVPTGIDRLVIDAESHMEYVESMKGEDENVILSASVDKETKIIRSKFIEMRGLHANAISRKKQKEQPILESYKFVPNETSLSLEDSIRMNVQILLENKSIINVNVLELIDKESCYSSPLSPQIQLVLADLPLIQPHMTVLLDGVDVESDENGISFLNKPISGETGNLLFVGSNLLKRGQILIQALATLTESGFILCLEDSLEDIPETLNLLTKHLIGTQFLCLLSKTGTKKALTTINITNTLNDEKPWLTRVQNALKSSEKIILYSENEEFCGILGLINCLRREPGGDKVSCVFIKDVAPEFDVNNDFYKNQLSKGMAINVYENGTWGTYRHLSIRQSGMIKNEHIYANVIKRGDLSSLTWLEGNLSQTENEDIVHIYYSAINFRDVMTASGKVPVDAITKDRLKQECIHGFEFSGRNAKGKRVMGMLTGGAIATMVEAAAYSTWEVPEGWSLQDAATAPVVYVTVLYSFLTRAQLKRGQSVLIHSATGGVGLAAINTALHYGCEIFVTVGTEEKRAFLNKHYPSIKNSHIGNSRDTSFVEMIHKNTNNRGVDIVLNSLSEEKLRASVDCLANGGTFLEIGKFDLSINNPLSADLLAKGCSFHGVMLDRLNIEQKKICYDLFMQALKDGCVKQLPQTIFKMDELEKAFRYMSTGKHIGKVLIKIRDEEPVNVILAPNTLFECHPRFFANSSASYIIVGGLGGFGLELVDWLITRGARTLVLSSRSGVKTGYQSMRIRTWRSYGVKIVVSLEDVSTMEGCSNMINNANSICPVAGVFNLGVVLKDGLIENQTVADYNTSFAPKPVATSHLDIITRESCPKLKYFVVFSSVSCGRGNAGQTNYGMANSIMERICEKRKSDGLPGLAIQWGAIGDVGLVAEMQKDATEIAIGGTLQQRISSCLEMMDIFLRQDDPVVASMLVAEKTGMGGADNMVDAVIAIMGLRDLKTISLHSTLAELGMDSMMAVEIKQTLERDFDVFLSAQDMRNLTFARLIETNEQKENNSTPIVSLEMQAMEQFRIMFQNKYDENTFKQSLVTMPTTDNSEASPIILFPGIECTYSGFKTLAENLTCQSISVQYNTNDSCRNITQLVDSIYEDIRMSLADQKDFKFVGHSIGSIIALEVASKLENEGYRGTIALLDGSPDLMKEFLKILNAGSVEFEIFLLCMLMGIYTESDALLKLKEKLIAASTFEEKQKIVEDSIPDDATYSKEIMLYMGSNIYTMINAVQKYTPTYAKIKSKLTLYKPNTPMIKDFPEDCNLSLLCEENIDIKHFDGTHSTIADNVDLAKDLNILFSH